MPKFGKIALKNNNICFMGSKFKLIKKLIIINKLFTLIRNLYYR